MADTTVLDNPDQQFADNVDARHDVARDAATATKYAPIGPSFTLNPESSAAMPSDANAAPTDPAMARYADAPARYKYQPLAAPISLADLKPQAPAGDSGGSLAGDVGKTLLGGLETGLGQVVRGVGKGAQMIEAGAANAPELDLTDSEKASMGKSNSLDSTADQLESRGASTLASRSPVSIMAEENSRLGGSITDPSTWTFGKDPSLRGYLMQGADALGNMAPVLLATYMSGPLAPVTGGLVGGAQSAGAAIEQARGAISSMDDATLEKQSKVYRKALAAGASKKDARQQATEAAENWAAAVTAPVGAVGGALTGKILSPGGRILGESGILGQSLGRAGLSGTEQALQNVGQGIATEAGINKGAGTDRDVTAGSFGNAVTGFVAGAVPGALHGAVEGVRTSKIPVADSVQPSDITFKGKPFISLQAARAAAAKAGDGAQVMRFGNRFIVRRPTTPGEELVGALGEQAGQAPEEGGAAAPTGQGSGMPDNVDVPTAQRQAASQAKPDGTASSTSTPAEFSQGDQVYVSQNGRSMPVEFVGYEQNAASGNNPERLARIKTPDGRGRFVRAGDLTAEPAPTQASEPAQLTGPASKAPLAGPAKRPALPAPDNVTAAGDGFIARPTFNIPENAPRGIRNNNPGNIEKGAGFQGETDGNDSRFATFSTPEQGIRGLAVNLLAYQDLHGLNTVAGIINRWAPASENKTGAYIAAVSKALDVKPDEAVDLHDPTVLAHLTAAIIHHENGVQPYPGEMIRTAVDSAISGRALPKALPAPTVAVDSGGHAMTADQRTQAGQDVAAERQRLDELGLTTDVAEAAKNHPATLEAAFHEAQTSPKNDLPEPTDAQKEAGNYKLGHVRIGGLDISVENPEGSTRSGVDADGRPWSNTMRSHYGYIRGTLARDGDHIDAFVKPGTSSDYEGPVYVVDQTDPTSGAFDEHKVMIGYGSQRQAEAAYRENYTKGWQGMGAITPMEMPAFKTWLDSGKTKKPVAELAEPQPKAPEEKAGQPVPQETGLGSIATDTVKPNGKGWLSRSAAQKVADESGGVVVPQGDRFVIKRQPPEKSLSDAFGDPTPANDLARATDAPVRGIGQALQDVAPVWAKMRAKTGGTLDITPKVQEAAAMVQRAHESGRPLSSLMLNGEVRPDPVTKGVLRLFYKGSDFTTPRSRQAVRHALSEYAKLAQSAKSGKNGAQGAPSDPEGMLETIHERQRQLERRATAQQPGGNRPAAGAQETGGGRQRSRTGGVSGRADQASQRSESVGTEQPAGEARKKQAPLESRSTQPQRPTKGFAKEIQDQADQIMAKLPGAHALDVHVVNRTAEVPESYEPSMHAEGVYYPSKGGGRIYLVADNLRSLDRARQVLAHEVVGHYGMEALLGDRFADVLADVQRLTAVPDGAELGVQRPGDKYYATLDAVKRDYPEYSSENQAREVLARMAETGVRPHFMQRVYGLIRKFLRGLGLDGHYSAAEIKNMIIDAAKRLRSATPEESRAGVLGAAESLRRAESRRAPSTVDMPDVVIGQKMGAAGTHADYKAAKAGDTHAAIRLVNDLVTPEVVDRVRQEIGGQDVTLVPVVAIESTGHNKIPMAVAQRLGHDLGLKVDEGGIYQAVRAKRSALGGLDRLFRYPEFDGHVEPGRKYFLVDDTLTQGGTFAALADHIRRGGGQVVGEFSLTGKQYSRTLRLSPDTLAQVRERYGDLENSFREATGRGFDGLTESEARYLVKHDSPDTIRNRILAEGHARVGDRNAKGLPPEVTPESDRQAPPSEGLSSGDITKPNGKGWLTRAQAQKVADEHGNADVVRVGDRFVVRPRKPGEPPMESRAATADDVPSDKPEKEPRFRGDVQRPGENLSKIEQKLRQRAMAKIGAFSEIEPVRERLNKLADNWRAKSIQGIFDQFAPLKKLNPVAYMQARLSKGTDGAVEALFKAGSVKLTDGALDVGDKNGGLVKILSGLGGEHDHWLAWIAGNRAKRLMAEGRENLFTPQDIDTLTGLDRGRMADGRSRKQVYDKALKEFNALQHSVLDVAEKAGLIDGETRHLWENEFYVPFYRVMEEDQTGLLGPGQVGGLVGQYAFKKLKGGQERLGDLLGNTLANWSHLLSASMKNLAAQEAMRSAVDMGIAEKVPSATKGSVRIMVKGHEQHFMVHDPLVLDALTALHFTGFSGPIVKAMSKFKHMLTTGVTISPTFRLRNLARDTISAISANDLSYNPARNLVDGWKATDKESSTYQRLLAGGGSIRFGLLNDGDQATHAKRLIEAGADDGQILNSHAKVKRAFAKAWEWYLETGDRAETVNRAAIYDQAIKNGKSHLEASYAARDLQDFTAGGKFASVRLLTQVVPFFNARLQGMYKLGRAAHDDPRRFMAVTGAVGLASAALFLANRNDPDYQQLPDWVRNNYWVTKLPGSDKFYYIPKPFEVGAMGSVIERLTELAVSGDDYQAKDFANTLLALVSSQLSMNPIPQAIRPAMGAAFNYDDFRERDIDSDAQMKLPAGDRYTARTSAGAVLAGKVLHVSPQRLEYMLKGYFGWLGIQALNVADLAARPFTDMPSNPQRDMSRINNWFMVGDFVKEAGGSSSKYTQRFYDMQRDLDQVYAAYSEARKVGDIERAQELAGDDQMKLRPLYHAAAKQIQRINQRIKQIDNDTTMSVQDKDALRDALYQRRNRIAMMVDERGRAQQ